MAGRAKPLRRARVLGTHIYHMPCDKDKTSLSANVQPNRLNNEKVALNSNYYCEHRRM